MLFGNLRESPKQNAASQARDLAAAITGIAFFGRRSLARTDADYPPPVYDKHNLFLPSYHCSNSNPQIRKFGADNRILWLQHWTNNAFLLAVHLDSLPVGFSHQGD